MSTATLQLDTRLQQYLHACSLREPGACRSLREITLAREDANLMSSPEQVQLLALLARLIGARQVLEVGTHTGYTTLWLALVLPDARFVCIDHDDEVGAIARDAWTRENVAERIDLRVADAAEALDELFHEESGGAATRDLAYIDADKENQIDYYEACLRLVRPGGIVAIDNTLWNGRVADPDIDDSATRAVRATNEHLLADQRIDLSLVPIGDGLTLARRIT